MGQQKKDPHTNYTKEVSVGNTSKLFFWAKNEVPTKELYNKKRRPRRKYKWVWGQQGYSWVEYKTRNYRMIFANFDACVREETRHRKVYWGIAGGTHIIGILYNNKKETQTKI